LGAGERSAIAVALNRKCSLAIDDSRAIQRALQEAALRENVLSILRTQDIVVELIRKASYPWKRQMRFMWVGRPTIASS
jgi:hypothetical protein